MSLFPSMELIGIEMRESNNEPISALQNPSTENPGVTYPANKSKSALITNVKIPSVRKFIGNVMSKISGRIIAFISAMMTIAIIADQKPSTEIPGTSQATNITAKA